MSKRHTQKTVDLPAYWKASLLAQQLIERTKDPDSTITNDDRNSYKDAIRVVDRAQVRVKNGATTGRVILDRLVASGQLMSPERLDELANLEQKLVKGEPALLQRGFGWGLGILADNALFFSGVNRKSPFRPIAQGFQALPVMSYIALRIHPFAIYRPGEKMYHRLDVQSIGPSDLPPEASIIGLPLGDTYSGVQPGYNNDVPVGLLAAWQDYSAAMGEPTQYGGRTHRDSLLVGRAVVETGLGISLESVLAIVPNTPLSNYINRTRAS